jgi:hypothetical protein
MISFFNGFRLGIEETLEDIGQVTHVELVVEVLSCLTIVSDDRTVEL